MFAWYAFIGTVRLPELLEAPDRASALAAARRLHPTVSKVQSRADYEAQQHEREVLARNRKLRIRDSDHDEDAA